MGNLLSLIFLVGGAAGLYFYSTRADASSLDYFPWDPLADPAGPVDVDVSLPDQQMSDAEYIARIRAAGLDPADYGLTDPIGADPAPAGVSPEYQAELNLQAFLSMVRYVESNDDYTALVGGGNFSDTSDHPANLGWPGIRRADGRKTTAAGGYQITQTTYNDIAPRLGITGFDEEAQDTIAVALIQRRRALELVMAGQYEAAMRRLVNEWEAFKSMFAGTYPITVQQALADIEATGGMIA